jgi:antitoxin (DNA-binding transcriptional repressor) of toxin-antitoxin stability system
VRRGREPVARITPLEPKKGGVRGRGSMKGEIWIGPDFDEQLEEFAEYER